ncbi:MAG: aminotransferase class V-fold PLP-dependent enzyme, partial [Nanoarchaeota archaeon]|nr:aminotransferase class V-fold PLP-dependent enzyme [Nanoarchaeota archaeon]
MKQDFPILNREIKGKRLVYLDNAATTQKPKSVIDTITNFYEQHNANVHRGVHTLSQESTEMYDKARQTVANFLNAEFEEIIFTRGTTESINLLANTLQFQKGDEIVLTEMEHHSNLIPWQQLAKEKNLTIKFIPVIDYKLDMDKAKELITEKTKLISVVHISNTLGTINPIEELTKLAHDNGALI